MCDKWPEPYNSQIHRVQVHYRVPELVHSRSVLGMILPFSSKAKVHSNVMCESKLEPDAGKDLRWEKKGTIEDKIVWWHHQLNGHEFE